MTRRSLTGLLAVTGAVLAMLLTTAGPAAAHAGDPTLVTRLQQVGPGLPAGVSAGLTTTVADQVVVTNPTDVPLVALDQDGAEFLRISAAGVEGNAASPYFHLSAAPADVRVQVPDTAVAGAAPQWVPLSDEPHWAWYDPRLSPAYLQVPVGGRQDVTETEELAAWSVPLRYGDTPVALDGALVQRPVTGRFETTLDPVPAGLSAVLGQGYVPSLSLQAASGHEVTVLGREGEPYLRFGAQDGAAGAPRGEVNQDSATHRDDLLARGRPVTAADTGWAPLPASATTWLDIRLRYPAEDPPAAVAEAQNPVEVARWEIPVLVDGAPQVLTGAVRWLPYPPPIGAGSPWLTAGIAGGAALLVACGVAIVLRNRRLGGSDGSVDEGAAERAADRADDRVDDRVDEGADDREEPTPRAHQPTP